MTKKNVFLLIPTLFLISGCSLSASIVESISATLSPSPSAPESAGVTGTEDATADAVLKGSLEPTITWLPVSGASQYKVSVLDDDGVTVRCPEVVTSLLTYAFSSCALTDKRSYKFHVVPFSGGLWNDVLELMSFTVDGLNLSPRRQEIFTGETLQLTAENGTGPFTYGDGGTGYVNASTGLVSVPVTAPAATLSLTIADAAASTNSTSLKVRAFADLSGFPTIQSQQGDSGETNFMIETSAGSLLASVDTSSVAWMGHSVLYRSTDKGATWAIADDISEVYYSDYYLNALVKTGSGSLLSCGSGWEDGGGEYLRLRRSIDDGVTWSDLEKIYGSGNDCRGLAVSPVSQTLIALESLAGITSVRRSTDNGSTWTTIATLSGGSWGYLLRVAPNGDFYAISNSNRTISKSTDDGLTWSNVGGFPSNMTVTDVTILADNTTMLASGAIYAATGGMNAERWVIYRSTDAGVTWSQVDFIMAGPDPQYFGRANQLMKNADGSIWAVGQLKNMTYNGSFWDRTFTVQLIRKSTDNGVTWSDVMSTSDPSYYAEVSSIMQLSDTRIIAAARQTPMVTGHGDIVPHFLRTLDNGTTWSDLSEIVYKKVFYLDPFSFVANAANRFLMVGQTSDDLKVHSSAVVRSSVDGGTTWQTGLDINNANGDSMAMAAAIDSNGNLFAVVGENDASLTTGTVTIKKSSDGTSWSDLNVWNISAGRNYWVHKMIALPDGSLMMTGTIFNTATSLDEGFVRKVSAAGAETLLVYEPSISSPASGLEYNDISLASDGTLWVAGKDRDNSGGWSWIVRKSTDGGATWSLSQNYTPTGPGSNGEAKKIAFNSTGDVFVAGWTSASDIEIQKSSDQGATWTTYATIPSSTASFGTFKDFMIDSSNRLFVASKWGTNMGSSDGGSVWLVKPDGSFIDVDHYNRADFNEAELHFITPCGGTICTGGVANSVKYEGRRFIVKKLSP